MKHENTKDSEIRIRITKIDKDIIEENSEKFGFCSVSDYLRYIGKNVKGIIIKV